MSQDLIVSRNVKRAMKYNCAASKDFGSVCKALKDNVTAKIDSVEAKELRLPHRINRTQLADNSVAGQEKVFHGGLRTFLHFPESEDARKSFSPKLKGNASTSKGTERLDELNLGVGRLAIKDEESLGLVRKIGRSQDSLSSLNSFGSFLDCSNNTASIKSVGKTAKKLFSTSRHFNSLSDLRHDHQNSKSDTSSQLNDDQNITKGLSRRHRKLSQSLPDIGVLTVSSANDAGYTIGDDSLSVVKPVEMMLSNGTPGPSRWSSSSNITSQQVDVTRESLSPCHNCLLYRRRKISKSLSSIARGALDTVHKKELQAFDRLMNSRESPTKTTNGQLTGVGAGRPRALSDPYWAPLPSCEYPLASDTGNKSQSVPNCTPPLPRRREVCRCPRKIAPPLDTSFNSPIFKRKQQSAQSLSQQMDNVKDLRYLRVRESKV